MELVRNFKELIETAERGGVDRIFAEFSEGSIAKNESYARIYAMDIDGDEKTEVARLVIPILRDALRDSEIDFNVLIPFMELPESLHNHLGRVQSSITDWVFEQNHG